MSETAQGSGTAARKPPVGRRFAPGQSGNPGGRAKGLAAYIRKHTKDGAELAQFVLNVLRVEGEFAGARLPLALRLDAATWLADRGFGRPVQAQEVSGPAGGPVQVGIREMLVTLPVIAGELAAPDAPVLLEQEPNG